MTTQQERHLHQIAGTDDCACGCSTTGIIRDTAPTCSGECCDPGDPRHATGEVVCSCKCHAHEGPSDFRDMQPGTTEFIVALAHDFAEGYAEMFDQHEGKLTPEQYAEATWEMLLDTYVEDEVPVTALNREMFIAICALRARNPNWK